MPGRTAGNSKLPFSFEILVAEMPVSTPVNVTVAPGTTPADASRTVPTTVAESNCADAVDAVRSKAITDRNPSRMPFTSKC